MKPLVSMPSGICHGPLLRLLAAIALAALGLVAGRDTAGPGRATTGDCTPAPSWPAAQPAGARAVLAAVNAHRATRGLAPLRLSTSLIASATWKARHMAAYNYMAHDDPAPPVARSFFDRVAACGYRGGAGENIARWYASAAAVVQAWLAEPGHRANIEGSWSTTGIAVAVSGTGMPYWVEDFGAGDAAAAADHDGSDGNNATTAVRRPAGDRPAQGRRDQTAAPGGLRRAGDPRARVRCRHGARRLAVPAPRRAARGRFSRDDRSQRASLSGRAVRELIG